MGLQIGRDCLNLQRRFAVRVLLAGYDYDHLVVAGLRLSVISDT